MSTKNNPQHPNKTILKNNSQKYGNSKAPQCEHLPTIQQRKCKSLYIENRIQFNKGTHIVSFPVFPDSKIGMVGKCANMLMDLEADEDFESTSSIVKYGKQLCEEDLTKWIKKPDQEKSEQHSDDYEF